MVRHPRRSQHADLVGNNHLVIKDGKTGPVGAFVLLPQAFSIVLPRRSNGKNQSNAKAEAKSDVPIRCHIPRECDQLIGCQGEKNVSAKLIRLPENIC
jgi:hypothetical protein